MIDNLCFECRSPEIEHWFKPVKKSAIPFCSVCWGKVARRLKEYDEERMNYVALRIQQSWAKFRRNAGRAKFKGKHLQQLVELKTQGFSVCKIAEVMGFPQSLVHRYLIKLTQSEYIPQK